MWAQPMRTADLRIVPPVRVEPEPRVAVLLNANARRVTEKVIRSLIHVVPDEDLFISRSALDARRIAQTVVDRRYHTAFLGGGDGTFYWFVNEILNQADLRSRYHQRPPRFGMLKLGTGNAIAAMLSASSPRSQGILDDVLRARAGEVPGYRRIDLISVEGRRTPFVGLGLDGKVLNDYLWVKQRLSLGPLKQIMAGGGGYFTSLALRTVPYYFTHSTWVDCEVINGPSSAAFRLGPDGTPTGEPIEPGALMFRGKILLAAASTVPHYGFEFKLFPFAARRRRMMHLRLAQVTTQAVLANLPNLWRGRWFPKGFFDFHTTEATIRFERPMPFQVAGDPQGDREQVTFSVGDQQVELVDFTGAVN